MRNMHTRHKVFEWVKLQTIITHYLGREKCDSPVCLVVLVSDTEVSTPQHLVSIDCDSTNKVFFFPDKHLQKKNKQTLKLFFYCTIFLT